MKIYKLVQRLKQTNKHTHTHTRPYIHTDTEQHGDLIKLIFGSRKKTGLTLRLPD